MNKQDIINNGLIEQYVLGLTDLKETQLVENLADKDPEILQYIQELRQGLDKYAEAYAVDPPADLREKVIRHIDTLDAPVVSSKSPATNSAPQLPLWPWLSVAAAVALALTTFWFWKNNQASEQSLAEVKQELETFKTDCAALQLNQQQIQKNYALLKDENTRHIHLRGSNLAPEALVVVFWNDKKETALLNTVNLPPPPDGHTYQLWADIDGVMVDMGILKHDPGNPLEIPFMAEAESLNITLEEAGGAEHPTVSRLYVNAAV